LPESHLEDIGCQPVCKTPCVILNRPTCYRAQCFETTKLIGTRLGLENDRNSTTFQSRLGRTPWIQPYTDKTLQTLAERGIKKLVIVCPSFVADCLETVEEIGIQARETWINLGGDTLTLVPCLNTTPSWIKALMAILEQ
jgi:ferrochelatase